MSRRAKIVCTLGPATSSQEQITALIGAGLDVARLNMSHGHQADHLEAYRRVRAGSDATGVDIVAMSFVRSPDDAHLARKIMTDMGRAHVPLIAKIEKPEAVAVLPD